MSLREKKNLHSLLLSTQRTMAFDETEVDDALATAQSQYRAAGRTTFASLCQALEENCIDLTYFPIGDRLWSQRTDDEEVLRLFEALRNNTVVQFLDVAVGHLTLAGARELTPFIAFSPSLSHVRISYPSQAQRSTERQLTTVAVANAVMNAIAANGRIQMLHLSAVFDAISLAGCLRGMRSSLVKLELHIDHRLFANTPHQDAVLLGVAINALDTLKVLDLSCRYDNFAATLLAQMGGVLPRLQHLKMVAHVRETNDPRDVFAQAVCNALDLAVELESFRFFVRGVWNGWNEYVKGAVLHHLLQILQQRTQLRSLALDFERCRDEKVGSLLRSNYHLEDLVISCKDVFGLCDVFEAVGTSSTLTCLNAFVHCDDDALFLQGLERLGTLLPEIKSLKKLILCCNHVFTMI